MEPQRLALLRDRSIVTVVSLMSQGLTDSSFKYISNRPKRTGDPDRDGRNPHPCRILRRMAQGMGCIPHGKRGMGRRCRKRGRSSVEAYAQTIFFPVGQPNDAYARYFTGQSYLAPIVKEGVPVANVTFEPGCRNNWHIHKASKGGGQTLICVGGHGYYQEWGKNPVELLPGDAVHIPAGVKHWHGAAPDSWFSHLAIEVPGEDSSNEWLEPVDEKEYAKLK